jgi:hypothetical protein
LIRHYPPTPWESDPPFPTPPTSTKKIRILCLAPLIWKLSLFTDFLVPQNRYFARLWATFQISGALEPWFCEILSHCSDFLALRTVIVQDFVTIFQIFWPSEPW